MYVFFFFFLFYFCCIYHLLLLLSSLQLRPGVFKPFGRLHHLRAALLPHFPPTHQGRLLRVLLSQRLQHALVVVPIRGAQVRNGRRGVGILQRVGRPPVLIALVVAISRYFALAFLSLSLLLAFCLHHNKPKSSSRICEHVGT